MATITNKTKKPLVVPLPGGKKLRLGPLKSAEIPHKAAEHPSVKKMVEAGDVEIFGKEKRSRHATSNVQGTGPSTGGRGSGGGIRKTGDR